MDVGANKSFLNRWEKRLQEQVERNQMLKRFTICRSERKEKKGVGRPNIVICLETHLLIVLYTFSIRVILTLRCPRRRKRGALRRKSSSELILAQVSTITIHTSM